MKCELFSLFICCDFSLTPLLSVAKTGDGSWFSAVFKMENWAIGQIGIDCLFFVVQ